MRRAYCSLLVAAVSLLVMSAPLATAQNARPPADDPFAPDTNPFEPPRKTFPKGVDPFAPAKPSGKKGKKPSRPEAEIDPFGNSSSPPKRRKKTHGVTVLDAQLEDDPFASHLQPSNLGLTAITYRTVFANPASGDVERQVLTALNQRVKMEYLEVSLEEVIEEVGKAVGIPVGIDTMALDEIGVGTDTPIIIHLSGLRLDNALKAMLRPLDLTFTVRHDRLEITTPERSEEEPVIRVYNIEPLLSQAQGLVASGESPADELIEIIQSTVHPAFWEEVGGSGVIKAQGSLLTVAQEWQIQREVHGLLEALYTEGLSSQGQLFGVLHSTTTRIYRVAVETRQRSKSKWDAETGMIKEKQQRNRRATAVAFSGNGMMSGPVGGSMAMSPAPTTVTPGPSLSQLAKLIKDVVDPASWKGRSAGKIETRPGILVIEQIPENHAAIEQMLVRLGLLISHPTAPRHMHHFGGGSFAFPHGTSE